MALPNPEPGLVLSYPYLWHHEREAGQEEGLKDRPVVVLLTAKRAADNATLGRVVPVTHAIPSNPESAVELPAAVKRHLGLDEAQSWILVHEGNDFVWPGHDLRKIAGSQKHAYGLLPPRLFDKVREKFVAWQKRHKMKLVSRS